MNKRLIEAACWRIWYRLRERGHCTGDNLMANCGIDSDVFDEAISWLIRSGNVAETTMESKRTQQKFELLDDDPRMMQTFPTLWSDTGGGTDDE